MKKKLILSAFLVLAILMLGNVVYGATSYETDLVTFELPDNFKESYSNIEEDYEYASYRNSTYTKTFHYDIYGRYNLDAYDESDITQKCDLLTEVYEDQISFIEKSLVEVNGMAGMRIAYQISYTYSTYYYDYYYILSDNYQIELYISSNTLGYIDGNEEKAIINSFYVADSIVESHGIPFTDVASSSWAYDTIKYVYDEGIMSGYGGSTKFGTKFGFSNSIRRCELVVMLYRMSGSPEVNEKSEFSDVTDSSAYYYNAVIWASENGIVTGYGETGEFRPTQNITRQELALMIYRYAKYEGNDVSDTASLSGFNDNASVASWAKTAVEWTVSQGIITGITSNNKTNINPSGNATRAQAATMISRYCTNVDI